MTIRPALFLLASIASSLPAQEPPARAPRSMAEFDAALDGLWSVDPDGRTVLTQDPWAEHDGPGYLFDNAYLPGRSLLQAGLQNAGTLLGPISLCPGGQDLASLCDAENHFRRLGLPVNAPGLRERISAERGDPADGLARRVELDRILAIGLARMHGHRSLADAVADAADDAEADPILRRAALDAAATLRGEPSPPWSWALPPLDDVLAGLPADITALMVCQLDEAPHMGPVVAASRRGHGAMLLPDLEGMEQRQFGPRKYTPREAAKLAVIADMPRELGYELARRFGNLRARRIVLAVGPPRNEGDGPDVLVVVDGLFELPQMLRAARAADAETSFEDGIITRTLSTGATLQIGPRRLTLRTPGLGDAPDGPKLADRLGSRRPTGKDLWWVWSEGPSLAALGSIGGTTSPSMLLPNIPTETPFPEALESLATLRLTGGVHYSADERFASAALAEQAKTASAEWIEAFLSKLPDSDLGTVFRRLLANPSLVVEGSLLRLAIHAPDVEPIDAFCQWMNPRRPR